MSRVLIVTSMSLPFLAADAHRARLLALELPKLGWGVELLVPGDEFQLRDYFEPYARFLKVPVPVHRAAPEWERLFRAAGFRSLSWRAYRPLKRLGECLLAQGRFDLVYFSCSQPAFFHLGVGWQRRFGIPFVVDIHDPASFFNLHGYLLSTIGRTGARRIAHGRWSGSGDLWADPRN